MGPQNQPDYVNAVCVLQTGLAALDLLDLLQSIEQQQGRQRDGKRWGARTLDLDLLLFGNEIINNERLQVPHPGVCERSFVLLPLLELAPEQVIAGKGRAADYLSSVEKYGIYKLEVQP